MFQFWFLILINQNRRFQNRNQSFSKTLSPLIRLYLVESPIWFTTAQVTPTSYIIYHIIVDGKDMTQLSSIIVSPTGGPSPTSFRYGGLYFLRNRCLVLAFALKFPALMDLETGAPLPSRLHVGGGSSDGRRVHGADRCVSHGFLCRSSPFPVLSASFDWLVLWPSPSGVPPLSFLFHLSLLVQRKSSQSEFAFRFCFNGLSLWSWSVRSLWCLFDFRLVLLYYDD